MTDFHVETVVVTKVEKHPDADRLSIAEVNGCPVIFQTEGGYKEGDLAVHVPVDAVVPSKEPFLFLFTPEEVAKGKSIRVKAKKLRGIFSMGLLVPVPEGAFTDGNPPTAGVDLSAFLGVARYEPEVSNPKLLSGESTQGPSLPVYDIEPLRKYSDLFEADEEVWITEKLHGASSRYMHDGADFFVGSHKTFKRDSEGNMWWKLARDLGLQEKLVAHTNLAVYGEAYGQVQDLRYGKTGVHFAAFDVWDAQKGRWFDVDAFLDLMVQMALPVVPTLYRGPWKGLEWAKEMAEGKSTMADHVREGIVVKPVKERQHRSVGRVFLKLAGQGYLLRKGS